MKDIVSFCNLVLMRIFITSKIGTSFISIKTFFIHVLIPAATLFTQVKSAKEPDGPSGLRLSPFFSLKGTTETKNKNYVYRKTPYGLGYLMFKMNNKPSI